MDRKIVFGLVLLLLTSVDIYAQTGSFIIKNVEPVRYTGQDGSLQILSYIKSDELKGAGLKARLDGKELADS